MSNEFDTISMGTITRCGLSFRWRTTPDYGMGAPWKEHDGHGPVEEPSNGCHKGNPYMPRKRPGQVVIGAVNNIRLYDFAEATRIAKRDSWGLSEPDRLQMAEDLGRVPTRNEVARDAVLADMDRMDGWLKDDWCWVMVECTLLAADGTETAIYDTLGGIESDNPEYHQEVAHELAEQILQGRGDPNALDSITVGAVTWRLRP